MRLLRLLAVVLLLGLVQPSARAAVPVLVLEGRGHGHGVGMAQDGAFWMARAGADLGAILGHFYPGAGLGRATGPVRVAVLAAGDEGAVLGLPGGGELRSPLTGEQAPGFPVRVPPGGEVRVRHDGDRYHVEGGGHVSARLAVQPVPLPTTTTVAPPPPPPSPTTTAPPSPTTTAPEPGEPPGEGPPASVSSGQPVWAVPEGDGTVAVPARDARYRGVVEATAADGTLRLVNQLDVEQYLRGMGEVLDPSWPPAALQAQAVAARTYAMRAMAANGELCDTQRCQVYLGQQAEYAAMDRAVADTAGQVLVHGGRLASAVYSASGGGVSATPLEGFAQPDAAHPYLVARRYETPDPRPYEVRIGLADLGRRLGYPGQPTGVRVTSAGPSGRALTVELDGTAGPLEVGGLAFGRAAGARSTLWSVRVELADAAPEPPPATDDLLAGQAPPEEVGRVTTAAADRARPVGAGSRPAVAATDTEPDGTSEPAPGWAMPALLGLVALAGAYGLWTLLPRRRP